MAFETITYDVDAGVARLALNRPDVGNAINLAMVQELMEATLLLANDASVRAVLVTGAGPRFCVGGDLKAFSAQPDMGAHLREVTTYLHAAVSRLVRAPVPVVAAVQGSAAGAGFSLAVACDIVLAATSTKFVVAYTRAGLTPDGSVTWFLPRLVGLRRALDLTLTNRVLTAAEAVDAGLVTRAVPDESLTSAAEELVAELAGGATLALGGAKALLRDSLAQSLESQMELESALLARAAGTTADAREGITAFLEKRAPRFEGR